jgi:hypothetical protein
METLSARGFSSEEEVNARIEWIIRLAGAACPAFFSAELTQYLREIGFTNEFQCAKFAVESIAGAILETIRTACGRWLVIGEALFFVLPMLIQEPGIPVVPIAVILGILLGALRLRDAYSYPSGGWPAEMVKDAIMSALLIIGCGVIFSLFAPGLALMSPMRYVRAVTGGFLAAQWRVLYHREDPPDPIRRELTKRKMAMWHMNAIMLAVAWPLTVTGIMAVPVPGLLRDIILGLTPGMPLLAWRLKKIHWTYLVDHTPLSIEKDMVLQELQRQRDMLPVWDGGNAFRRDLYVEAPFFLMLAYLPMEAAWWWATNNPLAAGVAWGHVAVNFSATVGLALLWIQIKKWNVRLAADFDIAIELRKAELAAKEEARYETV